MKLSRIGTVFDRILDVFAVLAALLLAFTLLSVSFDVTARKLVDVSLPWVIEVNEYILLYVTFLAGAWVLRSQGHVIMDLVIERLKGKARTAMSTITSAIGMVACAITTWYGVQITWEYYGMGQLAYRILPIPQWMLYSIIPIGSLLLSIEFGRQTYKYVGQREVRQERAALDSDL